VCSSDLPNLVYQYFEQSNCNQEHRNIMKVSEFDLDEVCIFLTAIGLGEKAHLFRDNNVDGDLLCSLSIEDLCSDLGLSSLQAKKLVRSMETENNEGGAPCASSEATLDHVKELETENAGLKAQIASLTADIQAAQGSQKAAMAAAKNPAPQAAPAPVPAPAKQAPPPQQHHHEVARGAAVGAAGGAAKGAIVGAILPGMSASDGAKAGAAVGALDGGVHGLRARRHR